MGKKFSPLPERSKKFAEKAANYLEKGQVREVEFSGSTYQVRVVDSANKEGAWAFLQFGFKDQLTDSFCSCQDFEDEVGCIHIAASLLRIYSNQLEPLHIRFNTSFWNHLCQQLGEAWAGHQEVFVPSDKGTYITVDIPHLNIVEITPQSTDMDNLLGEMLNKKSYETEETSLKFSNLPEEEIALWREGRPSAALQFELSFWSDLAKWMMDQQEKGLPYTISFEQEKHHLPHKISIQFDECLITAHITEEQWNQLIPSLSTVDNPLKVHGGEPSQVHYDQDKGILHLGGAKKWAVHDDSEDLPGWHYVPEEGFYPTEAKNPFTHVEGKKIGEVLSKNTSYIKTQIEGCTIHDYPHFPSYTLHFNNEWDLIITTYLFEPNDLSTKKSRIYGEWAYLEDDGFYRLEGKMFTDIETIVPRNQVNQFVQLNRAWLNTQEGFHTHMTQLESTLNYKVTEEGTLEISHAIDLKSQEANTQDFGDWVYVTHEGFYSTYNPLMKSQVYAGMRISKELVSSFIKEHEQELALIPQFFTHLRPIQRFALNLTLQKDGSILSEPTYEYQEGWQKSDFLFFDEHLYIPEEGFSKLPIDPNIPEEFHQEKIISQQQVIPFIENTLPTLLPFTLNISHQLVKPEKIKPKLLSLERAPYKVGFYQLKLNYSSPIGTIDAFSLYEQLRGKTPYHLSDAGLITLYDKRYRWLAELSPNQWSNKGEIILSAWEIIKMNLLDPPTLPRDKKTHKIWDEIVGTRTPKKGSLEGFLATLRPYQETGVDWLWHLWHQHLSGLLSDDMGLGKTLQALALIAMIKNSYKGKKRQPKFLIVCPTSVLYHWQDKIASFFPSLKVYAHWGLKRDLNHFNENVDVLLTTYGILRIDNKKIKKISFTLAVYDETQVAKNHTSLLYSALKNVTAKMRLGLTGTPIENNTRELKNIFDLILPNYLPKEQAFKTEFLIPIEKHADQDKLILLNRLISPFILRRKKEEVLTELPEKVEEIAHCPLHKDQYELYQSLLNQERDPLLKELSDPAEKPSYIHIFALLSKLKQVCNHPASYLKAPQEYRKYHSGKWELFKELLHEAKDSGQKVVVFSQFLNMLDIIEHYLNEEGIAFASIRGATQNRKEEIEKFQTDPDCLVFLGSLQAAGLGIELTAASVVIHYDRWWNAAREDQATDRVHRMGQTRNVQVFKMVTKDTFEERIDQMIKKKANLLEEIVGYDDQELIKKLTKEELLYLLSDIPEPNL